MREREHGAARDLHLDLLGRLRVPVARGAVHLLEQLPRQLAERARVARGRRRSAPASDPAASSRTAARTSLDSSQRRSAARSGVSVSAIARQNSRVPLARISWLVTVGICLIAALLLLLDGYFGYSGVLLAVGAAAAVNLL